MKLSELMILRLLLIMNFSIVISMIMYNVLSFCVLCDYMDLSLLKLNVT